MYGSVAARLKWFRQAQRDVDLHVATKFTVFDYLDPDEDSLSDVLRDLLDPDGTHGQATLFLHSFLRVLGVDVGRQCAKVVREDPTCYADSFKRRIDITLDFGSFGVGVENKPWAIEGPDQLKDYKEHLQRKYKGEFHLVYLSGDGRDPKSLGKPALEKLRSAGRFHKLSYRTGIVLWLEDCARDCKADKVRWFLVVT